MPVPIQVRVFGPAVVEGRPALRPRDRRVLAALVLAGPDGISVDRILAALYGDHPPPTSKKVVQGAVAGLRRLLGSGAIETSAPGYRLLVPADQIDVGRFDLLARQAEGVVDADPERAGALWRQALELRRGEPYADLPDWEEAAPHRARLEEAFRRAEEDELDALMACGGHLEAAEAAAALVEADPLRERRWAALALAQYRSGRQGEALRTLERARRVLADELGLTLGPSLRSLGRQIAEHDADLAGPDARWRPADEGGPCPYQGLAAFDVGDASRFFGREVEVAAGLARIADCGVVAIVGPSGCGKSSLARAGLAPALGRPGSPTHVVTPGPDPVGRFGAVPAGSPLVVDQLEELVTLCPDPRVRAEAVALLAAHARSAPLVLTLRADHVASVAELPDLARLLETGLHLLAPMAEPDLRAAIEGPATASGLRLEPGLVDLLVADAGGQPGALPLLGHALVRVWERREGRTLTVDAYRATGGVRGAIARTADEAFEALTPPERAVARDLLLRLVTVDGGGVVRHQVALADLAGEPTFVAVLDRLAGDRLVTIDGSSVQIAHEAIARAWPRLGVWLDEDAEGQRTRQHLASTASAWAIGGRDGSELYRGARLQRAEEWVAAAAPSLTPIEHEFLAESLAREESEHRDATARADAEQRTNRTLRRRLVAVAAALVVALAAGGVAVVAADGARRDRAAAEARARQLAQRDLLAQSEALRSTSRPLAALLAAAAHRLDPGPAALGTLLGTFTDAPGYEATVHLDFEVESGVLLPDGERLAATDGNGRLVLVDLTDGDARPVAELGAVTAAEVLAVSPDGSLAAIATSGSTRQFAVYDLQTGEPAFEPVRLSFDGANGSFSLDGSLVAVGGGTASTTQVHSSADGSLVSTVPALPRPSGARLRQDTTASTFLTDQTLLVTSQDGTVRVVDPRTGAERRRLVGAPVDGGVAIATSPDEATVTVGGLSSLTNFDLATGARRWDVLVPGGCVSIVPAESVVYCATGDGRVVTHDVVTGVRLDDAVDHQLGPVIAFGASPDRARLVAAGGRAVSVWRLDGGGAASRLVVPGAGAVPTGFDAAGRLLVTRPVGGLGDPDLIDPATGEVVDPLPEVVSAIRGATADQLGVVGSDGVRGGWVVGVGPDPSDGSDQIDFLPIGSTTFGDRLLLWSERRFQTLDADGRLVAPAGESDDRIRQVAVSPDGEHLLTLEGFTLVVRTAEGEVAAASAIDEVDAVAAGDDVAVVATTSRQVVVHDLGDLRATGEPFPGGTARIAWLQVAAGAARLLVVLEDRTVRIGDLASRSYLGGPLHLAAPTQPDLSLGAALRDDGQQLAVGMPGGVVVWDLDPDSLTRAACAVAGRDITRDEWALYIGELAPYRPLCGT